MADLRIMSNNIWACDENNEHWKKLGMDCSSIVRSKGFVRLYCEIMPDIIGFQECTSKSADYIMQGLKEKSLNYALLWGRDTPIIYKTNKFELIDSDYHIYSESIPNLEGSFNNAKTKSYCIAVLKLKENGKTFIFATTHLWWKSCDMNSDYYQAFSDEARTYQLNSLIDKVDELKKKYGCTAIIAGDFNTEYKTEAVQTAIKRGYLHAYDIATDYKDETDGQHYCYGDGYDMNENPKTFYESIDHILIKDAPESFVKRFERYAPDYYMPLSDHFPVWIDVEL